MFKAASPELVRRYYPRFDGEVFLHNLQAHVLADVVSPIVERNLPEGGVAVDLGCGAGTMAKDLSATARVAIGVDVDDSAFRKHDDVQVASADERELDRRTGTVLVKTTLSEVPVRDASVDFVTSRWVFEHLEDPGAAVREIERILKPGGVAMIVVPNRRHPGIFLSSLLPLRVKQTLLRSSSGVEEDLVMPTYYRVNTGPSLESHFRSQGLERLELHYVRDASYWLFSRTLFRTALAIGAVADHLPLKGFRMHIVGVFRKPEGPSAG